MIGLLTNAPTVRPWTPVQESGVQPMTKPMTSEELRQIAAEKFEEARALPPGPDQQKVFIAATGYRHAADVRGWLSSELRTPK